MKAINDGIGHGAGDAFLHEIASRIRRITRDVDTPARLGGDEFVVLLTEFDDPKGAGIYARKLLASLRAVWTFDGQEIEPGASIGIAGFPEDASTAAMYEAKRAGGNQIFEHAPEGPRGIA
jgi:diguanylate cyclase (GGDEF)-like protein